MAALSATRVKFQSLALYRKIGESLGWSEPNFDQPPFDSGLAAFVSEWQAYHLLRKDPSVGSQLGITLDPQASALADWYACEELCRATNLRWSGTILGGITSCLPVLQRARHKIEMVLGQRGPSVAEMRCSLGPGATFCHGGVDTSFLKKMSHGVEMTFASRKLLPVIQGMYPGWHMDPVQLVHGSGLFFVPKTIMTHRSCCKEPTFNGWVQHGLGAAIRARLRRFGVHLEDQEINANLALVSRARDLATVDLSSASDLIAFSVVQQLLPESWVDLLDAARSHRYFWDGKWTEFEKFSSMGNAFTFELETLIFWALSTSCCEELGVDWQQATRSSGTLSVYGDDIILPSRAVPLLREVLTHCGFKLNEKKTFTGLHPFRESCGMDCYFGVDVTPFRIQRQVIDDVDVFCVANAFRAWFNRCGWRVMQPHDFHVIWKWVCSHSVRPLFGPAGYGDGHIHVDWDEMPPPVKRKSLRYPRVKCLTVDPSPAEVPDVENRHLASPFGVKHWEAVSSQDEGFTFWSYVWEPRNSSCEWTMSAALYTTYLTDKERASVIGHSDRKRQRDLVFSDGVPLRELGRWRKRRLTAVDWAVTVRV